MEIFLHDLSWVLPLRTSLLTSVFQGLSWLGYPTFFLIFLPIGYWLWNKQMFTRLAVLVIATVVINAYLKDLLQDPRPDAKFALDPGVGASFGFPSGHAQTAVAMWLWFASEIKRWWMWALAIVIAVGVCFSRLYLGVHDVEDVLGGAILGLLTIALYRLVLSRELRFWYANISLQLVVLIMIHPLIWLVWPPVKDTTYVLPFLGFLFGWWVGVVFEKKWINFGAPKNWIVATIFSVILVVVLVAARSPLEKLLTLIGLERLFVLWFRAAFTGIYATALVPFLFKRIHVLR